MKDCKRLPFSATRARGKWKAGRSRLRWEPVVYIKMLLRLIPPLYPFFRSARNPFTVSFSNCLKFLEILVTNPECTNFHKLTEPDVLSETKQRDAISVTEVVP